MALGGVVVEEAQRENVLRGTTAVEEGLGDGEIGMLVIDGEVGFLEESSAQCVLRLVGGSSQREVPCWLGDERVGCCEVEGGVGEDDLHGGAGGEIPAERECHLRVSRQEQLVLLVVDEVYLTGLVPLESECLFKVRAGFLGKVEIWKSGIDDGVDGRG